MFDQVKSVLAAMSLSALAVTAHAAITLPTQGFKSDSVQTLSEDVAGASELMGLVYTAKGNATPEGTSGHAFRFPITKVVLGTPLFEQGHLNVASGASVGSALNIERVDRGVTYGITLANFTVDYKLKQVMADVTPRGGATVAQLPVFNFNLATPLAFRLEAGLKIVGTEVLDQLFLTPEAKEVMKTALNLPVYAIFGLDLDYGTLTQNITLNARKPAASTKPYVPTN